MKHILRWCAALVALALALPAQATPEVEVLSSYDITSWYNSDGSAMASNGGGGNGNPLKVLNGTFGDYQMLPRCLNGGYIIIDLSQNANAPAGGYYVSSVKVDTTGEKAYSVYTSSDGSTWTAVEGASSVKAVGIATYEVGAIATQVKYVFNEGGNWDFNTEFIAEVQVLGLDPADVDCTHPSFTAWTSVANTATCEGYGEMERFCTVCGERFTMVDSTQPPLGHHYVSHLEEAPTATTYGHGYVECSRCGDRLTFNSPVDVVTLGGQEIEGKFQFTDINASSCNHPEWGPHFMKAVDNDRGSYWLAQSCSHDEYFRFKFGGQVDIVKIELAVRNHDQVLEFYNWDGTTETFVKECVVTQDESKSEDSYQLKTVYFWADDPEGCTFDNLIVRFRDNIGLYIGGWGYPAGITLYEIHPYATVVGGGMNCPAAEIGDTGYATLADAIAAVEENAAKSTTIVLAKTVTEDVVIPANKDVTLNLNGNSITNVASDTISVYGTLTIMDGFGGGEIVSAPPAKADLVNYPTGTVTIQGGTFAVPDNATYYNVKNMGLMTIQAGATVVSRVSTASTLIANGWYGNATTDRGTTGQANTAILTINGGTFDGGKNVVKNDDYGILTINGGTFGNLSENDAVIMNWHETTITGGTFTGATKVLVNGSYGADSADKGVMTVSGGTFTATAEGGTLFGYGLEGGHMADAVITVTGGTFSGAVQGLRDNDGTYGFAYVSGGTFDEAVPQIYCAEGFAPTAQDENGKFTVKAACTVSFTVDAAPYTNIVVFAGEPVAKPTDPVKAGYAFTEWTLDGAAYDFSAAVTNDIELVANFQADQIDPVDPGEGLSDDEIAGGAVPAGIVTDENSGEVAFVVCFHGHAGVTYTLQGSTSLDPADWTSDALVVGEPFACTKDGQLVRLEFPMDANAPSAMFFKIGASRTPSAGE